jgi:hypothetical protein
MHKQTILQKSFTSSLGLKFIYLVLKGTKIFCKSARVSKLSQVESRNMEFRHLPCLHKSFLHNYYYFCIKDLLLSPICPILAFHSSDALLGPRLSNMRLVSKLKIPPWRWRLFSISNAMNLILTDASIPLRGGSEHFKNENTLSILVIIFTICNSPLLPLELMAYFNYIKRLACKNFYFGKD